MPQLPERPTDPPAAQPLPFRFTVTLPLNLWLISRGRGHAALYPRQRIRSVPRLRACRGR